MDCIGGSLQEYEDTANRILFFSEAFVEADEEDEDKDDMKDEKDVGASAGDSLVAVTHSNNTNTPSDLKVNAPEESDAGLDDLQKVFINRSRIFFS